MRPFNDKKTGEKFLTDFFREVLLFWQQVREGWTKGHFLKCKLANP